MAFEASIHLMTTDEQHSPLCGVLQHKALTLVSHCNQSRQSHPKSS